MYKRKLPPPDSEGFVIDDGFLAAYLGKAECAVVPSGVRVIGNRAFQNCTNLKSVSLPQGVTAIYERAFALCKSLEQIIIPEGVTRIERACFMGCDRLCAVKLPESLTAIGDDAFSNCYQLWRLELPKGIKHIGAMAFWECRSLSEITVPGDVERINESAFRVCTSLKSVTLERGIERIARNQFRSLTSLEEVVLPDTLKYIGSGAFSLCPMLKSLTLPDSVTEIACDAFEGTPIDLTMSIESRVWRRDGMREIKKRLLIDVHGSTVTFTDKNGTVAKAVNATQGEKQETVDAVKELMVAKDGSFSFEGYDQSFKLLKKNDNKLILAICRLLYPYKLTKRSKGVYTRLLAKQGLEAGKMLFGNGRTDVLFHLASLGYISPSALRDLLEYTSSKGDIELTAVLLEKIEQLKNTESDGFDGL